MDKYWEIVKKALIEDLNTPANDPAEWTDATIDHFIDDVSDKIIRICKEQPDKENIFNVKFENGVAYQKGQGRSRWQAFSQKTFKNIFKYGKGASHDRIKNAFAIYFGYDTFAQLENETTHKKDNIGQPSTIEKHKVEKPATPTKKKRDLLPLWLFLGFTGLVSLKNNLLNPLVLTGMVLLLFFSIHRLIIQSGLLSPIDKTESSTILQLILKYGFYIALALTVGGMLYANLGILTGENKSKTSFKLLSTQVAKDISDIGFLIRSFKEQEPKDYRPILALEEKKDFYKSIRDDYQLFSNNLQNTLDNYPLTMAVYDAHKANLKNKKQAQGLLEAYSQLEKSRNKLWEIIKFVNRNIQGNRTDTSMVNKIQHQYRVKIVEAQIELGSGVNKVLHLLNTRNDIDTCIFGLKAGGYSISKQKIDDVRKEITQQITELYQKESDLIKESLPFPHLIDTNTFVINDSLSEEELMTKTQELIDQYIETSTIIDQKDFERQFEQHAKRQIDEQIKLPYLKWLRENANLPSDSLTKNERLVLMQKELNTDEKDLTSLINLISTSFYETDEQAIIFYLEKALQLDTLSPITEKFLSLSLKRMQEPDLFDRSIGIMLIKILPQGALAAANCQPGDVIYKINGKAVMHPEIMSKQLAGTQDGKDHEFHIYRDGVFDTVDVKSNLPLGARLTPLISWYEIIQ